MHSIESSLISVVTIGISVQMDTYTLFHAAGRSTAKLESSLLN